jgi:hypothetical protein
VFFGFFLCPVTIGLGLAFLARPGQVSVSVSPHKIYSETETRGFLRKLLKFRKILFIGSRLKIFDR